jgi:signal transduction histidine kinase
LSIAKGFVEAHGGNIEFENRPAGGARFSINIPTEIPDIQNLQEQDDERK